jgi:uncharacterized membrane protein
LTGFLGFFAFAVGALVCHQLPERSFFLAGRQFPVCARCSGLYAGVVLGLVAWWVWRRLRPGPHGVDPRLARNAFLVVLLPTAVSWVSGELGFWDGSNLTRAVLALPLGVTAGAIVAAVATKDLR